MRSLKQNLRQGILITLIYLVYGAFLAFDIYAARNGIGNVKLPAFYEQVARVDPPDRLYSPVFAYCRGFEHDPKYIKHSFFSALAPDPRRGHVFARDHQRRVDDRISSGGPSGP